MFERRVFTVGKDTDKLAPAKLGQYFYPGEGIQVEPIAAQKNANSFVKMPVDHLNSMVFLGHGSVSTYGGSSPTQFAKNMSGIIPLNKKLHVQDVYLVGCNIGLIDKNGVSIAQKIADALHAEGFVNVKIHAVAQPEEKEGEQLIVSVITKKGFAGIVEKEEGYISACLLSNDEANRYDELYAENQRKLGKISEQDKNELKQLEQKQLENSFLFYKNPKTCLDQQPNIFNPNESLSARKSRVADYTAERMPYEQKKKLALDLLQKRVDYLKEKNKKKKKKGLKQTALEVFIKKLQNVDANGWQNALRAELNDSFLSQKFLGVKLHGMSNTSKLLLYLCQDDFDAAKSIIENQGEKKKGLNKLKFRDKAKTKKGQIKEATTGKYSAATIEDTLTQPILKREEKMEEIPVTPQAKKPAEAVMSELQQEFQTAITRYTLDIDRMEKSRFKFFHSIELDMKQKKRAALQDISRQTTPGDMYKRADFYSKDSTVMYSFWTNVAEGLINKVKNEFGPVKDTEQKPQQTPSHNSIK